MIKKIRSFFQGHWRYVFRKYLPIYLKQQIAMRYKVAQPCFDNGSCLECGCRTPELFYASKACSREDDPCYPELMSKKEWKQLQNMKVK